MKSWLCTAVTVLITGAFLAGATPAVATPATPDTTAPGALADRGPDLDNFSTLPAYAAFYGQQLAWSAQSCRSDRTQLEALPTVTASIECAKVTVPKDWYHPEAGTISVAISRLHRSPDAPRPARLLLSNRGGPGGDGLVFGVKIGLLLKANDHLAVGIDPRGVGESTQLTCPILPEPPDMPEHYNTLNWTEQQFTTYLGYQQRRLAACDSAPGSLMPYINSDQTARDYDLVRHVMGYRTTDFLGVSYGTWLGTILAKMFPQRVDRMVVDSNVDFESGKLLTAWTEYQPEAFQASFERVVLPWLARHHSRWQLGTTAAAVHDTLASMRDALSKQPPRTTYSVASLDSLLTASSRSPRAMHVLASRIAQLRTKIQAGLPDSTPQTPAEPVDVASLNVFDAVRCNDSGSITSLGPEVKRVMQVGRRFPLQGQYMADMTCIDWPRPPAIDRRIYQRPMHGVLMAQLENDAATGYRGSFVARWLARGQVRMVLSDDGHGHGALTDPCVLEAQRGYLAEGVYPAEDVHCQAGPLPLDGATVYEFGFPASQEQPLSQVFVHRTGELTAPVVDAGASTPHSRRAHLISEASEALLSEQLRRDLAELDAPERRPGRLQGSWVGR